MGATVALLSTVCSLVAGDVWVHHQGRDTALVAKVLYYQNGDPMVHRASQDPVLHYELRPGARYQAPGPPRPYTVTIGDQGQRAPLHPLPKPPGAVRILFLGGSTVYGAALDDQETLPARLEAALDQRLGAGRVEVWNFGTSAYTRTQQSRLGTRKLEEVPGFDLVLTMVTNRGRRAFLPTQAQGGGFWPYLAADPDAWLENFPPPQTGPLAGRPVLHLQLLRHSALYRVDRARRVGLDREPPDNPWAEDAAQREALALKAAGGARGVPVAYILYPQRGHGGTPSIDPALGDTILNLERPGLTDPMYEIHPPAWVLDAHAQALADGLLKDPTLDKLWPAGGS